MSDGNFNKNLLPYNNYKSGFRAGSSQMKRKAISAFDICTSELFPDFDKDELLDIRKKFIELLER